MIRQSAWFVPDVDAPRGPLLGGRYAMIPPLPTQSGSGFMLAAVPLLDASDASVSSPFGRISF